MEKVKQTITYRSSSFEGSETGKLDLGNTFCEPLFLKSKCRLQSVANFVRATTPDILDSNQDKGHMF